MQPHVQYTWMVVSSQALERKREEQRRLQEENMRINAETMRAKEQRREEEKLADRRDMEYIQKKLVRWKANDLHRQPTDNDKYPYLHTLEVQYNRLVFSWLLQEREAEYEAEERRTKKEKELEIARMRAQQEKAKDYKAEQVRSKPTHPQKLYQLNFQPITN